MSPCIGDDGAMNTNDARRSRPRTGTADPIDYAARRLRSLLLVPAAIVGVAGLVVAEGAGLGHELAIVIGLTAFLGATAVQTMIVSPRQRRRHGTPPTAVTSVSTWNK
jgi:hypothetical protein